MLRTFFSALNETIVRIRADEEVKKEFMGLVELAGSPVVASIIGESGVDGLNQILNGLLHDETVLSVVQVIKNILTCFSVDRFVPVATEKELERQALALDNKKLFFAAVYFDSPNVHNKDINYKLRMITDNTPITLENRNRFWFPGPDGSFEFDLRYHRGFIEIQNAIDMAIIKTKKNETIKDLPPDDENGELDVDDDEDFNVTFDPFADIEKDNDQDNATRPESDPFGDLVDHIKTTAENNASAFDGLFNKLAQDQTTTTSTNSPLVNVLLEEQSRQEEQNNETAKSRTKRQFGGLLDILFGNSKNRKNKIETEQMQYYTKQFSYPKYTRDDFKTGLYLAQSVQMAFFFALIVHVALAVRQRIWMKESGNSSLMRAMGLKSFSEHFAWWLFNFVELALVFLVALIILFVGGIMVTTGKVFIYIFLLIFGICVLAFW